MFPKLSRPHFLYQNIITPDNVTATSSAADFPVSSLSNPLTAERWKPTTVTGSHIEIDAGEPVTIDSIGFASHTLGIHGVRVTVRGSDDLVNWSPVSINNYPSTDSPIMIIFPEVTYRYFMVLFTEGTAAPSIGAVFMGKSLVMPLPIYGGHTPITMGRQARRITNKTEGGQFAGNSVVRLGVRTSFRLKNLKADWYRENFEPFAKYLTSGAPFFASWRPSDYPNEVGYCWPEGDVVPTNMGIKDFMEVEINVSGYGND